MYLQKEKEKVYIWMDLTELVFSFSPSSDEYVCLDGFDRLSLRQTIALDFKTF